MSAGGVIERPIPFDGAMVRAILDGTKTQTRRIAVKTSQPDFVYPVDFDPVEALIEIESKRTGTRYWKPCPYGQPGGRLWVRETWQAWSEFDNTKADEISDEAKKRLNYPADGNTWDARQRQNIHMPRWASRILLDIVSIRVEQLQTISEADVAAEGTSRFPPRPLSRDDYKQLWERIYGANAWSANPWVWVIEFKRVQP